MQDRLIRERIFRVTGARHMRRDMVTRLMIELPEDMPADSVPLDVRQWVRFEPGGLTVQLERFGEGWVEVSDLEVIRRTGRLWARIPERMIRLEQREIIAEGHNGAAWAGL